MSELRPVVTYPRDAIVAIEHVAEALGVSKDRVAKMDLPCTYAGRTALFVWGQVLDVLAERALPSTPTKMRRAS